MIKQLDNFLQPADAGRSPSRAALIGLGGSGKTELATKFAESHRKHYTSVFWVNATDAVQLMSGFSRIAKLLGVGTGTSSESEMDLARDWLINNSGYLLIIDNVDEDAILDQLHRRILRTGMNGTILITGRNESIRLRWNAVEVSDMTLDEALTLFSNITGTKVGSATAGALLKELGYPPLAIDQAATFMSETKYSIEEYWKLFDTERSFLLQKYPSTQYNINGRQNVMTTWEISFKRLQRDHPEAANLLLMFSLMDHEEILYDILKSCFGGEQYFQSSGQYGPVAESERWIPDCLGNVLRQQMGFIDATSALQKYSLARSTANSQALHIHPLVHFWASQRLLSDEPLKTKLTACVLGLIGSAFEKQDRLPPFYSRAYGPRGLEEAKLGIWPVRKYTRFTAQALHCLKNASAMVSSLPQTVVHLVLCLLQVFEYATYGDFDTDQGFIFNLLETAGKVKAEDDDCSLNWTILTWRLVQADLCKCRKYVGVQHRVITSGKLRMIKGQFCTRCTMTFEGIATRLDSFIREQKDNPHCTPLIRCLVDCLTFRLASDSFWIYWAHSQQKFLLFLPVDGASGSYSLSKMDIRAPLSTFLRDSSESFGYDARRLANVPSSVEIYGLCARKYLLIRSYGEHHYGGDRDSVHLEPMEVASFFEWFCGRLSEEHRRAAFYATMNLFQQNSWAEIESYLQPFVLQSIEEPDTSWSHERCIIGFIDALLKQDKNFQAAEILGQVKFSYARAGKRLLSIDQSRLWRSSDVISSLPARHISCIDDARLANMILPQSDPQLPVKRDIQIFVKTLTSHTCTVHTNTCATVRSVINSVHERTGVPWSDMRLIYGGKQLEADRFLSDYNI